MLRTCLFDMGNVLVRFSHERMCEQIGEVAGRDGREIRRLLFDAGLQRDFERGEIGEPEFHARFEQAAGVRVAIDSLRRAGSDIFTPVEGMRPLLDELKSAGVRLVLLSNTSVSHFEFVRAQFDVLEPFDACVVSYEVGAVKPDPAIYAAATAAIDCEPGECFYTDDIPEYVAIGREHGLQAEVFTGMEALRSQLRARGIAIA